MADDNVVENAQVDAELRDWWAEDAIRLNNLAEVARHSGMIVDTGLREPPPLNADGSLKEDTPTGGTFPGS
jgi:hypothetical protein